MITLQCSGCNKPLKVANALAGKKGKCPHCGELVHILEKPAASPDDATLPPDPSEFTHGEQGTPHSQRGLRAGQDITNGDGPASELIAFLAPAQGPGELGRLGPYRILQVLGAGGMGVVYKAEDPQLKRQVALKAMLPTLGANASARQRFLREAQSAAAIEHDHIVHIYQVGEDRGIPFLAMQFLKGEALDDRLKREKVLPLGEVLRIGRQTAAGLAAAHKHGLIHRDIKPANLWLEEEEGRVKILDFGLARATGDDTQLTQQGVIVGTPAYMAPEQASGKADQRSDLFSLGCVLYRISTGSPPFSGTDTMSLLASLALDTPRLPREVNPALPAVLSDLIMQLLAKDPAKRPASAQAVGDALRRLEEQTIVAMPASAPARERNQTDQGKSRSRLPLMLGGAAALLLAAAGGAFYFFSQGERESVSNQASNSASNPEIAAGAPLSPRTLVMQPASLPGVHGWSLEPRCHSGVAGYGSFSPDSKRVASGGLDGSVRIWDAETHRLLRVLLGHEAEVACLAWSPDGKVLATGSQDRTVRLWDANSGRPLHALKEHSGRVRCLAWSVDGKNLASGSADKSICLWDVDSGKQIAPKFTGHSDQVSSVGWRPDGKTLVSSSVDGKRCLWEAKTAMVVQSRVVRGPAAWSQARTVLVFKSGKNTVDFWEADTGRVFPRITLRGLTEEITALAWSADEKTLATGAGKEFQLWDARSGKRLRAGGTGPDHPCDVMIFSRDGKLLLTREQFAFNWEVWNVQTGKHIKSLRRNDHVWGGRFSADGRRVLSVAHEQRGHGTRVTLDIWEIALASRWQVPLCRADSQEVAWSPDGRRLAGTAVFEPRWDNSSAQISVWEADAGPIGQTISLAQKNGTSFYPCSWSPDGKLLATSAADFGIGLADPLNGKTVRILSGKHTAWVQALAWSPDSKKLASFAQEGRIWDAVAGQALSPLTGLPKPPKKDPMGHVVALAWSPDGKTLASANNDWNGIDLWDMGAGKHTKRLEGHKDRPAAVAWSPDGEMLASGGADRTVRLWKKTGEFATELKDDRQGKITALAWLDGKTLATFGANNRLCVWDVAAQKLQSDAKVPGTGRGRFSPDGKLLASLEDMAGTRLFETATGRPLGTLFLLRPASKRWVAISADGHYRAEPPQLVEREFVYVVGTEQGQDILTPEEFATKYSWKNDPEKVHLLGK